MKTSSVQSGVIRLARGGISSFAILLMLSVVTLPGCGSCSRDPDAQKEAERKKKEEELARKKKEKKPDFEIGRITLQPGDASPTLWVKPGHWVGFRQSMKTNHFDFVGQLETAIYGEDGQPASLDHTPYRLTTTRPAVLPKGQRKYLETVVFVPGGLSKWRLSSSLQARRSGGEVFRGSDFFLAMPSYQYYLAVLSRNPDRFGYLKVLDSVRVPWATSMSEAPQTHYQVVLPKLRKPLPLPSDSLAWSSIAYIFWDDVDPELLSPEQQQAMLDWLHWGGSIVIDGPNSLDGLRSSFLDPYLPADAGEPLELDTAALAELDENWTLRSPFEQRVVSGLVANKPWSGVTLAPRRGAAEVPKTGGMLVERFVGRGRIVVSAFRLTERDLVNWHGFDGFFNACLLRRPRRAYDKTQFESVYLSWADGPTRYTDSGKITGFQYFSRDTGKQTGYGMRKAATTPTDDLARARRLRGNPYINAPTDGLIDEEMEADVAHSAGSWNPFSAPADAARNSLRQAAGIVVPKATFVVWVLALYLIILVPLNWAVFAMLGKVEWAWIAAPVIAVACSLMVIKLARLDIGFVRSQTEIAVLELHGDYPRGHVTRYTALYTSLSTSYDLHFDSPNALAQPFPTDRDAALLAGQSRSTVTYRRDEEASLTGLKISSNSTGMVHSEHMLDLNGAITLGQDSNGNPQVINGSSFDLVDVGLVRKRGGAGPHIETCWIGDLAAGASHPLVFDSAGGGQSLRTRRLEPNPSAPAQRLDLADLFELAEKTADMKTSEVRLVGRIDGLLPGTRIEPRASQVHAATMVLAYLDHGDQKGPPEPDLNTRFDVGAPASSIDDDLGEVEREPDRGLE